MDSNAVNQIVSALAVIHYPSSTNQQRREAQEFLNKVGEEEESPFWGYQLALPENNNDPKSATIIRHYGLSLLQRSVRNSYDSFDMQKCLAVRAWIIELANKIEVNDPIYIREKMASIWVDIAKRCWGSFLEVNAEKDPNLKVSRKQMEDKKPEIGGENNTQSDDQLKLLSWPSMDRDLFDLWNKNLATKELSLIIFRTLFEDIYILDDPIATRRSGVLSMLCSEIIVPVAILEKYYARNQYLYESRADEEGWMVKWTGLLYECLQNGCQDKESANFTIRILQTLKTCFHWVTAEILIRVEMLNKLSQCLLINNVKVKILAIDCLHVLFIRNYGDEKEFLELIAPVFQSDAISMLLNVYRSIKLDADDVDAEEYSLLKKLVELGVSLSSYLEPVTSPSKHVFNPYPLPKDSDISGYLKFILETTCNESLIISGLSTNLWITILRMDHFSKEYPQIYEILPNLLEVAASKYIPYECLDEDHTVQKFLQVDFDSQPDSNNYMNNYKKSLDDIIRITTCKLPKEAIEWLENRLSMFFSSEMGSKVLNGKRFKYDNGADEAFIYGVSQLNIIEAVIKGISRWRLWYDKSKPDREVKETELLQLTENLFNQLLQVQFQDPLLCKRQIQALAQFTPLIKQNTSLIFNLLERIFSFFTIKFPSDATDEQLELYRDLRSSLGNELNRLAIMAPENFVDRFSDLENVVKETLTNGDLSSHDSVSLKSFLLLVSLKGLPVDQREEKFSLIVDNDLQAWNDPQTIQGLNNLHWFMERLGIVKIANYFKNRGITAGTNLIETPMDEEGKRLRNELKKQWAEAFPTRQTRVYMLYSIEKLQPGSAEFEFVLNLWKPRITPIVLHVLKLICQIQNYHDPNKWNDLPVEVQSFVKVSCTERFWHIGISTKSKDTYVEENVKAALTLRDFADSVGHIVRYTREYAFLIIGCASQFGDVMYSIPDFSQLLWNAVAGDTVGVTLHSWKHMIQSCLRPVIQNCPVEYANTFLMELLSLALPALDELLNEKWSIVMRNGIKISSEASDDELSDEMFFEHLTRQVTALCTRVLIDIVGQFSVKGQLILNGRQSQFRAAVIKNKPVLEKVIKLVYDILTFKDSRCCYNMILIMRGLLSELLFMNETIDQWLCGEILPLLVKFVTDPYYHEMAADIASLICEIYIPMRSKYDEPKLVLQNICGLSDRSIDNMEKVLSSCRSAKQQRNLMHQVIISKQNEQFQQEQRKRAINRKKKATETDLMNKSLSEDPNEGGLLNNLFS
ncbi:karyopherin [Saccharomycopsis crataegensis]|uniref:Karyopherin n=1 Tax=Saccharomycopsis crataegensis TaxID=43959 RepID=A0AAV5QJG1_9ASCO|nr:karyopherin [Saccharomycopsis crataegensis]